MNPQKELIRRIEARHGREEADIIDEILEQMRLEYKETNRLQIKDELREELMTQKDFEYIKAEFGNVRREMNDKFETLRREMDLRFEETDKKIELRFAEMDKRIRIYLGIAVGLMLLLHPSVGAVLARFFGG